MYRKRRYTGQEAAPIPHLTHPHVVSTTRCAPTTVSTSLCSIMEACIQTLGLLGQLATECICFSAARICHPQHSAELCCRVSGHSIRLHLSVSELHLLPCCYWAFVLCPSTQLFTSLALSEGPNRVRVCLPPSPEDGNRSSCLVFRIPDDGSKFKNPVVLRELID
jgi:hypothetical protein